MAGERVLAIPAAAEWPGVAEERDPVIRWYRALCQLPGVYRMDGYATQKDSDGIPVIGAASAWFQLGERPEAGEALGMAATVGAFVLTTWMEARRADTLMPQH
ncbi:MAG: hypothetical protein ACYCX3_04965 [Thermoleophilia bacterium]